MKRNHHPVEYALAIALVLMVLGAIGRDSSSSSDNSRVSELEQQIVQLQDELEALRQAPVVSSPTGDITVVTNAPDAECSSDTMPASSQDTLTTESGAGNTTESTTLTPTDSALQATIRAQLESNTFANWYSVATCQNATAENMMALAEKISNCTNWNYSSSSRDVFDVFKKAVENPAMTDAALAKMCEKPSSFTLFKYVAESPYAEEQALTAIIAALNRVNDYGYYSSTYDAHDVIKTVVKNVHCTDEILTQLETTCFGDLKEIVEAPCASTKTLTMVANRLMQINDWSHRSVYDAHDVLSSIVAAHDTTDEILVLVVPRNFSALVKLARSEKASARTLCAIIEMVQAINDWNYHSSYDAYDVVKAVTENPNNSLSLMEQLATTNNSTAQTAAHDAIEKFS